jgi:hypothetical protein
MASPTMAPPTDPAAASTGNRGNRGKSFFDDFPRELRDKIYDLTSEHEVKRHSYHMRFQAPVPHLRLISRQFKHEYDERQPKDPSLAVEDRGPRFPGFPHPYSVVVPRLATQCTVLHFTHNVQDRRSSEANLADLVSDIKLCLQLRFSEFALYFGQRLPRLQKLHIRANFNFVQNLQLLVSLNDSEGWDIISHLRDGYRFFWWQGCDSTVELCHLNMTYPCPPGPLVRNIPGLEALLGEPTVLVSLRCPGGNGAWSTSVGTIDILAIEQRSSVEAATLVAWETEQGCSLDESKRMQASV